MLALCRSLPPDPAALCVRAPSDSLLRHHRTRIATGYAGNALGAPRLAHASTKCPQALQQRDDGSIG